jgi:hypothetical protein
MKMQSTRAIGVLAAVLLGAGCSTAARTADGGGAGGSCAAPFLRADAKRSPPGRNVTSLGGVPAGSQVQVYGFWYYAGPCRDTGLRGQRMRTAHSLVSVTLTLTAADGHSGVVGVARPEGRDSSFVADVLIPRDTTRGPATIDDGGQHIVRLVVTDS